MSEPTAITELEGAVLTEIGYRGQRTSFQVRKAFQQSPTSSWSGSAGAVYPAIERLAVAGLVHSELQTGGRGTRLLSLTANGEAALLGWAQDTDRAGTLGADSFRLRVGLWRTLTLPAQLALITKMRAQIGAELAVLGGRQDLDPIEAVGNRMAILQQQLRLDWLDGWDRELRGSSPPA